MERMPEFMLSQMVTSFADIWLVVTYVLCMFMLATFRPRQIGSPAAFRRSYTFFLSYFIAPHIINAILFFSLMDLTRGRGGDHYWAAVGMQVTTLVGRVLLGLSVFFGMASLLVTDKAGAASTGESADAKS